jgi:Putative prokaryotic signal transducing protein
VAPEDPNEPVVLDVVGSEFEADVICGLLQSEGVDCTIQKTNLAVGMADASASAAGPREIVVQARDLARAREILSDQPQV